MLKREAENKIIHLFPDSDTEAVRLDKYLADELDDYSRSYIAGLIDKGLVLVNNSPVKASWKAKYGDEIEIRIPAPETLEIVPESLPLDIRYEDDDIIIINKPQGMVVHPAAGNYTGTLVNGLMYHCADSLSTINGVMRPGIVHRIDKNTSGLLVVCKNDLSHRFLAEQFACHSITRVYTAICYNHFITDKLTIDRPIGRDHKERKKMAIDTSGRRAVTHVTVEEKLKENFTLISCRLETGRTHQIRVHLSSLNHPILGDDVYGPKKCPYNLSGQMLHAGTLGFIHPSTKEYIEFKSDLPDYFTKILTRLRVDEDR